MAELKGRVEYCKLITGRDPDQWGNKSYNVKFIGDEHDGLYLGKKPEYFTEGKEVDYIKEEKVAKSGKIWYKISIPKKDDDRPNTKSYQKSPEEIYKIWKTVVLKAAIQLMILNNFEDPKEVEKISVIAPVFLKFIEERKDNDIAAETAIAQAVETLNDLAKGPKIKKMEVLMKLAKQYYDFIIEPKPVQS